MIQTKLPLRFAEPHDSVEIEDFLFLRTVIECDEFRTPKFVVELVRKIRKILPLS